MTNERFNKAGLAIALLAAIAALAACSSETAHGPAAAGHAPPRSSSSAGFPAGNLVAGEKLATSKGAATGQACVDCHGADGNAPIDASYPKLGGQYGDYLAHALKGYRDGKREHALMSGQAKGLTDQQIADVSAYFASRESKLKDLTVVN